MFWKGEVTDIGMVDFDTHSRVEILIWVDWSTEKSS